MHTLSELKSCNHKNTKMLASTSSAYVSDENKLSTKPPSASLLGVTLSNLFIAKYVYSANGWIPTAIPKCIKKHLLLSFALRVLCKSGGIILKKGSIM